MTSSPAAGVPGTSDVPEVPSATVDDPPVIIDTGLICFPMLCPDQAKRASFWVLGGDPVKTKFHG